MKFSIPQSPLYETIIPFLPEEGEYDSTTSTYTLNHRVYSVSDWIQKQSIHECIVTYEDILITCANISKAIDLIPIFDEKELWVLDTGSILWIPQKFTSVMEETPYWMLELSKYLQRCLLESRRNQVDAKTIRDLLGSIPITYTLERMTYNMPYAVMM